MLAGAHGRERERGERRIARGDDDRADGRVPQCDRIVGDRLTAWHRPGQVGGPGGLQVAGVEQGGTRRHRRGSFSSDQTASDEGKSWHVLQPIRHSQKGQPDQAAPARRISEQRGKP